MNTIWISIFSIGGLGLIFGIILGYASNHFKIDDNLIVKKIDELLPQSQCGQCGYPGCHPYAEAIGLHGEKFNRCVPGGKEVRNNISKLFNNESLFFNEDQDEKKTARVVAVINESICIGCTKCIRCCPVDAIVGAIREIHTVIEDLCTGCSLCVIPCPMQCITIKPIKISTENWKWGSQTIPTKIIFME